MSLLSPKHQCHRKMRCLFRLPTVSAWWSVQTSFTTVPVSSTFGHWTFELLCICKVTRRRHRPASGAGSGPSKVFKKTGLALGLGMSKVHTEDSPWMGANHSGRLAEGAAATPCAPSPKPRPIARANTSQCAVVALRLGRLRLTETRLSCIRLTAQCRWPSSARWTLTHGTKLEPSHYTTGATEFRFRIRPSFKRHI
ncbi:hypothetical protein E6O75_ATG10455 [Venturia nashicola]|uniref:Uncharacterized protein n=1 Tax=Venturia nashicola TaxID=86259 RepID=A0A4Z1NPT9_9PEZI|nr:hypothetical protein E6O75_ATG10455 [Venturia nashicola]